MRKANSEVLFTVPEFAFLVRRREETIRIALRDGKLKGIQKHKKCLWRIPESELLRYWGKMYGEPGAVRKTGGKNGRRHRRV